MGFKRVAGVLVIVAGPVVVTASERALVGRVAEVEALADLLDALDPDHEGSILQVAGEAGIGKSRLLRELGAAAEARGHLVLSGRAAEFEGELPFGVFCHALDDWLRGREPAVLKALAKGSASELAIVLPAFERLAVAPVRELQQERYRAHRAVRTLLSEIATVTATPLVLVLDDVQWADPGSVELLGHLLAHPPRGAVLLALAFRPAQVAPPLAGALALSLRGTEGRRLDLAPLNVAASAELLGPGVSDSARDRLFGESGGNPFFLLQLARAATLISQSTQPGAGTASGVPEAVRAAIATELSSLSAPALLLLHGAAVAGDPFEGRLAAHAAGIADEEAYEPLDELLQFHLVHPTDGPGSYAFRHPIVRATVSELTTAGWRRRAHGRAAEWLAGVGASSAALAPHVERSAAVGDSAALAVLIDAGDRSASRAPALAARWYRAALGLLPEGPEREGQRIQLLIAEATARGGAGQLEESRSALVQVLERLPATHPARVSVVAFCAGVEHLLGRHRDAHARLVAALAEVADRASPEAVQLMAELAAGAGYENRYDDMMRWAQEALVGATALGARALVVVAAGQVALAGYFLGLPAGEAMDRAAEGLDDLDDAELAARLDIGLWVGWSEAVLERSERAIEHCRRVIAVSRATGQGAFLLVTMTAQAWSLIRLGRLAEADEILSEAIEAGRLAPNLFLSVAAGLSAVVATARGSHDDALQAGEESVRLARSADPGLIPGMSGVYAAIPLIERGEAQQARDLVLAMNGGGPELQTSRSGYVTGYELLTRAELLLDDVDAAEEWSRRAVAAAGAGGAELVAEAVTAQRAVAAVALARGQTRRAAQLMVDAAARADEAEAPLEAGRCRILAARAFACSRHRARAVAELERAVEALDRAGADGYRAEAERELRRVSPRTARMPATSEGAQEAAGAPGPEEPAPTGWDALTPRERAVVDLVAAGLSNAEVAERLFLSRHTVKRHLANAMLKAGVHSRVRLAHEATRRKG